METFDQILSAILQEIEAHPDADIDQLLAGKMKEMKLSGQGQKLLAETNAYLNAYEEAYARLQASKQEDRYRQAWISGELMQIGNKHGLTDEQKAQLASEFASVCEAVNNETAEKGA